MSLVKIKNLCRTFYQGDAVIKALDNVSIEVKEGAFTAVNGPSGSGKSTLLNAIGTIDTPDSGEYWFDGEKVDYKNDEMVNKMRSNNLGFVFQSYNLLPVLSAVENVEMSAYESDLSRKELRTQAESMLEAVGLGDKMNHRPSELSGGQQQRVSVARSLIGNPKLVLADEPTANLDSTNTFQLIDLMLELNQKYKTAFLFSTHDDRLLENVKHTIRLVDGKVVSK